MYPYDYDPNQFITGALSNLPGVTPPVMPKATPGSSLRSRFFGPMHQALHEALMGSLARQNALPGLISEMQADPSLATQIGGLLSHPLPMAPQDPNFFRAWQPGSPSAPAPASPAAAPAPAPSIPAGLNGGYYDYGNYAGGGDGSGAASAGGDGGGGGTAP